MLATCVLAAGPLVAQPIVPEGFPNVARTEGELLAGPLGTTMGRLAILAYHNGLVYSIPEGPSSLPGYDLQVRTWDFSDPSAPAQVDTLGVTTMPINAHGFLKSGDFLVLGANWPPEAPWSFRYDSPGATTRIAYPELMCASVRGCLFAPWYIGGFFWSYLGVEGNASIEVNGVEVANWNHLAETGVIGQPFLLGDLLIYGADQSRTGVAVYDVSNPSDPTLLDLLTEGAPGGYWPEIWGGNGGLFLVFPYRSNGNGIRVVDITDPTDAQLVADTSLPGDEAMYIQFQDEYAFVGSHKVDMRTFQSVLQFESDANGVDMSQFAMPLGNLLVTGGSGAEQGMAVWAHQAEPDLRGPEVGFHVPQAGRTNYPVGAPISLLIHETLESPTIVNGVTFIVRPLGGEPIDGRLTLAFDDVLTFTPSADLLPNTTYEVVLPGGGIKDAAGNGMVEYLFSFSTGAALGGNQAPDISSLTASTYPAQPGASLTLTMSTTDPEEDPIEHRFDFGDGRAKTEWASSDSVAVTFDEPGHFRVTGQARDAAGALSSRALTVTVVDDLPSVLPRSSSQVACRTAERRIWVVNPDNNSLAAIDPDNGSKLLEQPTCSDPRSLVVAGAEVWVSCFDDDSIAIHDLDGTMIDSLSLGYGSGPMGLVASSDESTLYVALQSKGDVVRIDRSSRGETGRLPVGPTPRALALTGDDSSLFVTRFRSGRHRGEVWEVDTATMAISRTFWIRKYGDDAHRDGTADGRGVATDLVDVALDPRGEYVWVVAKKANIDGGLLNGQDLDHDNTVRNVLVQIELAGGSVVRTIDVDNSDSASAIAFTPLGDYAVVALQGNDEAVVFDALLDPTLAASGLVTRLDLGSAPQGICVDGPTRRLFAKNLLGRDVTIAELSDLLTTGSKSISISTVSTVAAEAFAPEVLLGKTVFYGASDERMSAEAYLSCASCHLDGGHDGRVWDFTSRGEGLRNTTDLRGRAGMAHGNVHWSANFDEIQDFENDIRGPFGGIGFLSDSDFAATEAPLGAAKAGLSPDLDAVADYVASLSVDSLPRSPYRSADGSMTEAALRGTQVFLDAGCNTCHSGVGFTDSTLGTATLHDVGTLRDSSGQRLGGSLAGIDTPTLLGVWDSAPYLHDGSAATLDQVFVMAGGHNIQVESGAVSGASVINTGVDLNQDDTVRNRAFVFMNNAGGSVTLSEVDGGSGGVGALEVRYSSGFSSLPLEVRVNGNLHTITLFRPFNFPEWRHTLWDTRRIEGVDFTPGATNTIELLFPNSGNASLDELVVSSSDDLAAADPHRLVSSLPAQDVDDLLQYLLQLDGREPAGDGVHVIFVDGFESGSTAGWAGD